MRTWILTAPVTSVAAVDKMEAADVDTSDKDIAAQVKIAKATAKEFLNQVGKAKRYQVSLSGRVADAGDEAVPDFPRSQITVSVGTLP